MNNILIFSGLPAVGKTTALEGIHELFGSQFLYIPEFVQPFPEWFAELSDNNISLMKQSQQWVVEQHILKMELARENYPRPIIMDRSVMAALAFGWGFSEEVYQYTLELARSYNWPEGNVLFLDADLEIIKNRFIGRGEINEVDWYSHWKEFMNRLQEGYSLAKQFSSFQYHLIEANKERQIVLEGVASHIKNLERGR